MEKAARIYSNSDTSGVNRPGTMRIISLSPAVTEILFTLGKAHSLVCRDQFSDYPEAASDIPLVKGHQKIDVQEVLSYKPDLVFASTLVQAKLAEELRAAKLQVIHQDPRSLSEVEHSFLEIGVLLECEERARELSLQFRQTLNEVKKRARALPRHPRVYIEEWHHPPMVSGNWVPEVVKIAGGIPFDIGTIGKELGSKNYEVRMDGKNPPSREVSLQEIQAFDPELIVLSICGAGALAKKELLTDRPGWATLPAVREGRVRVIDDSLLNRPGPRLVEGARRLYSWMFELLHS